MGWISKRHMESGGSIGGRRRNRVYPKDGAPLRKVVGTIAYFGNIFQADIVLLECGHEGRSWGGVRARCPECKKA
jgi:hypothetical protein